MKGVFSRETEELLYYTDGRVDWDKHLVKELGNIDPTTHAYVGTYSDGNMMSVQSDEYNLKISEINIIGPKEIFENELDSTTTERITDHHGYPLHKQLNIMMDAMEKHGDFLREEEFQTMFKVIRAERNQNKKRKDEMKKDTESFNYIEKNHETEFLDDRMDKLVVKINAE